MTSWDDRNAAPQRRCRARHALQAEQKGKPVNQVSLYLSVGVGFENISQKKARQCTRQQSFCVAEHCVQAIPGGDRKAFVILKIFNIRSNERLK
jgi:hypothetical protein